MAKLTRFTVRGRGTFPFDMLRYDQAWPTTRGVSALESLTRIFGERPAGAVEVELTTPGSVTDDRWASFGWTVVTKIKMP